MTQKTLENRRMDGLDVDKPQVMEAGWGHGLEIPDAAQD
jgi:hypothetical protein